MVCYDVALWLSWSPLWPEIVADGVAAVDAWSAVVTVMEAAGLTKVKKAAANDGLVIRRWSSIDLHAVADAAADD